MNLKSNKTPDLKRILLVNTYGIGDVLFTIPVIDNLRRAYPEAHITYLANSRTKDFLIDYQNIDDVLTYDRDDWVAIYRKNPFAFYVQWMQFINQLKRDKFDAVMDFSLNGSFGACWILAGIPLRIGYDYKGRGWALNYKKPLKGFEGKHVIEYYLDLLALINVSIVTKEMSWGQNVKSSDWAKDLLQQRCLSHQGPIIALVPGGGQSWGQSAGLKRWPVDNFCQLTDKMIEELNAVVILVGSNGEVDLARQIEARHPTRIINVTGQTTLSQMAALFKQVQVVIANDGGPLHVAVANQVKTVSIFGPVDPVVYGPFPSENHRIANLGLACQPCYQRFRMSNCSHLSCLRQLDVDAVYRKVKEIL